MDLVAFIVKDKYSYYEQYVFVEEKYKRIF